MKNKHFFSIVCLAFSSAAFADPAQSPTLELAELQNSCKLKQVTQGCSTVVENVKREGICIDAQQYGLICSVNYN